MSPASRLDTRTTSNPLSEPLSDGLGCRDNEETKSGRLYILSRANLREFAKSEDAPRPGDSVAIFRQGQDPDRSTIGLWQSNGINVIMAEWLVSMEEARSIEAEVRPLCYSWFLEDGKDVSVWKGTSLGAMLAPNIWLEYNLLYLVRAGIIFVRLIRSNSWCSEVITDIVDGAYFYSDNRARPITLQWRSLLYSVSAKYNLTCRDVKVGHEVPSVFCPFSSDAAKPTLLKLLLSCFSSAVVWTLLKIEALVRSGPVAYFFVQGEVGRVAAALGKHPVGIRVFANIARTKGVLYLAPEWTSMVPGRDLREAGGRLRHRAEELCQGDTRNYAFNLDGVSFEPWFTRIIQDIVNNRLDVSLIQVGGVERMLSWLRPEVVVVSAAWGTNVSVVSGEKERLGYQHYFINHGHNYIKSTVFSLPTYDASMIYISEGQDHDQSYGYNHSGHSKPKRATIANPSVLAVSSVCGRRPKPPVKVILVLNHSCSTPHTIVRAGVCDQYLIDIINVARRLQPFGIRMVYRPHPGEIKAYAEYMIDEMSAHNHMKIDDNRDIGSSLLASDAVITSLSTGYYQSLYAGWPTILHEPGFAVDDFVGLPAASDTGRPLSTTEDQLFQYVLDVYNEDSAASQFPSRFSTELSGRFFGSAEQPPDQDLANYLLNEIVRLGMTNSIRHEW